jgi:hypothetical protein
MVRFDEEDVTVVTLVNVDPDDGLSDAVRDEAVAWTLDSFQDART